GPARTRSFACAERLRPGRASLGRSHLRRDCRRSRTPDRRAPRRISESHSPRPARQGFRRTARHARGLNHNGKTMGFKCGIVGLPNVGKSTLFNALTQTALAQAANYPFCTIEPNVGEVAVPDPRLDTIARIANSAKIVPTFLEFVDIAGLVRGASRGEGLGNQFLANIREV